MRYQILICVDGEWNAYLKRSNILTARSEARHAISSFNSVRRVKIICPDGTEEVIERS